MVDFDAVFKELIAPAIEVAGIEPLRADEEKTGGTIHKPMFEQLILCQYAVADLSSKCRPKIHINHMEATWLQRFPNI